MARSMRDILLAEITEEIAAFESISSDANSARREHVEAHAYLKRISSQAMELAEVLDRLNELRLEDDPELLAGWRSARNVFGPYTNKPSEPDGPPDVRLIPPSSEESTEAA